MKRFCSATLTLLICAGVVAAAEETKCTLRDHLVKRSQQFGCGWVNCITFWIEVPRNLAVQLSRLPDFGLIRGTYHCVAPGVLDGVLDSSGRLIDGAFDIITLGGTDGSYPTYVWQDYWRYVYGMEKKKRMEKHLRNLEFRKKELGWQEKMLKGHEECLTKCKERLDKKKQDFDKAIQEQKDKIKQLEEKMKQE